MWWECGDEGMNGYREVCPTSVYSYAAITTGTILQENCVQEFIEVTHDGGHGWLRAYDALGIWEKHIISNEDGGQLIRDIN